MTHTTEQLEGMARDAFKLAATQVEQDVLLHDLTNEEIDRLLAPVILAEREGCAKVLHVMAETENEVGEIFNAGLLDAAAALIRERRNSDER